MDKKRENNNQDNQKRNARLGQGLKAFFGEDLLSQEITTQAKSNIFQLNLKDIKIANWQPRKNFDEISQLAESIKIHGVVQPILVKQLENNKYELIAGERRFRACRMLELETIPAIVRTSDEQEALEISMIENLQRQDLNAIEKAEGFAFLIEKLKLNQEDLAKRLGMSRSAIANFLRINALSEDIKEKIRDGKISAGHAKALVNKENASDLASDIVKNKLSVREVEEKLKSDKKKIKKESPNEMERFQEMISNQLGVPVKIECEKNSGTITLEFANLKKLEEIISFICLK